MGKAKIIITGACGMIGSVLVHALNRRGISDLLLVDSFGNDERWKNLYGLEFSDIVSPDDFLDMVLIGDSKLDSVETVFHIGACSSTTETDMDFLLMNNVHYSQSVASWAIEKDARFIFASSAATYGDGSNGFKDDESGLLNLRPLNGYGFSKHLFDLWALKNSLFDKIASLKYFNVFGPNEYHKGDMRSMVLKAFEQIRNTGRVCLFKSYREDYKDGEQERDFIYVKDAVDATVFFMENRDASGVFNIGTGKARTWNDMMKAIFAALGREPKIEYIEMPDSIKGQYQYHTQADISKLRAAGYSNDFMELEDSVKDYVQNYLTKGLHIGE